MLQIWWPFSGRLHFTLNHEESTFFVLVWLQDNFFNRSTRITSPDMKSIWTKSLGRGKAVSTGLAYCNWSDDKVIDHPSLLRRREKQVVPPQTPWWPLATIPGYVRLALTKNLPKIPERHGKPTSLGDCVHHGISRLGAAVHCYVHWLPIS